MLECTAAPITELETGPGLLVRQYHFLFPGPTVTGQVIAPDYSHSLAVTVAFQDLLERGCTKDILQAALVICCIRVFGSWTLALDVTGCELSRLPQLICP
jgi:hypothetical protein